MQATGFFAVFGLTGDQVSDVDDVAQLTDAADHLAGLEEFLGLLIQDVQTVPGAVKTQIAAHDAHIGAHDLAHFLLALADEHHLLGMGGTGIVPSGDILAPRVLVDVLNGMLGGSVGIHHRLDERIARQTVAAVQTRAGALAHGIQTLDAGAGVEIHLDTATQIVRSRHHGDIFLGDVDAQVQAVLIDVGEVMLGLLGILVRHVKIDMVLASLLHLAVDGAGHHVTRCE